ncbi:MAG TPA: hypothetical protein VN660_02070 [Steroidobacteraceae bacterium]|nr:hypothetical protein [Steroidobacteraceae bacterium]
MSQQTPSTAAAAPADLDQQLLVALKQPTASSAGPINPDSPGAYAQAAATGASQSDANPTLQLGYSRGHILDTHIPIPTWLAQGLSGAGGEAVRLGQGAKQTVGMQTDPLLRAVSQQELSTTAGKVGGDLADMAITAPIGGAATSGLAKLGGIGARIAGNALGNAAVQGAVQGAITANPGQRLEGAGLGAALAPVLPLAARGVGSIATGLTRTPEAQALLNRGVQLSPGELNPDGTVVNRLEQAATHIPIIGGKIANVRGSLTPQISRLMVDDAAAPGATVSHTGDFNDAVADLKAGYDNAYQSTLGTKGNGFPMRPAIMNSQGPDVALSDAFQRLAARPALGLTAQMRSSMGQQLQDQLNEVLGVAKRSGGLEATDLQSLRSALRDASRDVSPVDNASRAQRGFWDSAQQLVSQAMKSQLPPDVSSALDDIDAQYGKFATVREVAKSLKDKETPTLQHWSTAVARTTPPNVYASGGGWNRDLLKAATAVGKTTVPNTGATGAGTIGPIIAGIEGAMHPAFIAAHPVALGGVAGGLGALYGAYTRPGLRLLAGQTAPQRAVQGLLQAMHPAAKEAIGRYARTGLLNGLLQPQLQGGGLLSAPDQQ